MAVAPHAARNKVSSGIFLAQVHAQSAGKVLTHKGNPLIGQLIAFDAKGGRRQGLGIGKPKNIPRQEGIFAVVVVKIQLSSLGKAGGEQPKAVPIAVLKYSDS